MTIEEARKILATYKMPMTNDQLAEYREALKLVQAQAFIVPKK